MKFKPCQNRAIAFVIILAIAATVAVALVACDKDVPTYSFIYDDTDRYAASSFGSFEGVKAIEIDWIHGFVQVEAEEKREGVAPSKVVTVRESVKDGVEEDRLLHYLLDDEGVLHLKFLSSGVHAVEDSFVKNLVVTVPYDLYLDKVTISTVTAMVKSFGVMARDARVKSTSGDLQMYTASANYATQPRYIAMETASGSIGLNILDGVIDEGDDTGAVNLKSGSGKTTVSVNAYVPALNISTTSGGVETEINAGMGALNVDCMSGRVELRLNAMVANLALSSLSSPIDVKAVVSPKKMNITATSSTVTLRLDKTDVFKLTTNSRIEISFIDLSHRSPAPVGYVYYYPQEELQNYNDLSVIGGGVTLRLEEVELPVFGDPDAPSEE